MHTRRAFLAAFAVSVSAFSTNSALAIALDPVFAGSYSFTAYTGPADLATPYGGLIFKAGDPNTIIIGGAANTAAGAFYTVPVTRDAGQHITGFGAATFFAAAPYNDGGVAYAPNGTLIYARWPVAEIGQIKPGSVAPDLVTPIGAPFVNSMSALGFIPPGFPGAGQMLVTNYGLGQYATTTLTPDGFGTYNIGPLQNTTAGNGFGPEGFVFIDAGNPQFSAQSLLVAEYGQGRIAAYELDANGIPIEATLRIFISGLGGAEGAAIDPLTGDFLFSTFGGGNQLVVVQGFTAPPPPETGETPIPGALPLFATGLGALGLVTWRRRRKVTAAVAA